MGLLGAFKRAFKQQFGYLEGDVTGLKNGQMAITIENGKCIAYTGGMPDIEISKNTVKEYKFIKSDVVLLKYKQAAQQPSNVNVYEIIMKDGKTGTMQLDVSVEKQVLDLLK